MKNIKAKSVALSTTAVITLLSSTCNVKAEEAQPTVSPESTSQSETAAPAEKLKAPEAVSDRTGSHSLTIQTKAGWQYSISTEEDLLGTDWTDQTKEDGEYTFDHLNENTVYYIQGRTTDDAGNVTAVSEVLSVSTKSAEKEEKQDSAESTASPASETTETPSSDEAASTESAEAQATEAPVQVNKMKAKVMAATVKAGEKYQNGHWYFVKSDGTNATGITNIGYKTVYYNKNGEMQFGVFRGDDGKLYLSDAVDGTLVQKQGEKYVNGHWYYVKADGTLATGVTNIGYKTVYYNQNGEMQFGTFTDSEGKLRHSDPVNGTLSQNGFEYFNNGHWYYVKADGSYATGVTNIGYKTVYYNEKGEMQFGYYRDSNDKLCHSDPVNGTLSQNGFEYYNNGHWYFVKPDGSFATGLTNIGYKTVYYSEKGEMHFGEKNIGGYWYFFDLADGSMRTGFVTLPDGRKVYYDGAGHMVFGKQLINGNYYCFNAINGAMQYGEQWINGVGYYFDASTGIMKSNGWLKAGNYFYHLNASGVMDAKQTNGPQLIYQPGYYISPMKTGNLNSSSERIEAMISRAYDYVGTVWRACYSQQPGGYADCSGLVMQCLLAAGFDPSPATPAHHAQPQNEYDSRTLFFQTPMQHVSVNNIRRGDLIFYAQNGIIIHVAIYLGNGQVIDSWPPRVTTHSMYWRTYGYIYGVARPFN